MRTVIKSTLVSQAYPDGFVMIHELHWPALRDIAHLLSSGANSKVTLVKHNPAVTVEYVLAEVE